MKCSFKGVAKGAVILSMSAVVLDGGLRMTKIDHPFAAILQFLIMFVAYLVIAIWLARLASRWLGERASRLFWPATTVVPPPLYYLIELYVERGDLNRALFEYEKVIHYHPQELRAHLGRLEVMAALGFSMEEIEKNYRVSFKTLKSDEALHALNNNYSRLLPV